jgi:hypothetical protein
MEGGRVICLFREGRGVFVLFSELNKYLELKDTKILIICPCSFQ